MTRLEKIAALYISIYRDIPTNEQLDYYVITSYSIHYTKLYDTFLAFVAFSLTASGIYILNDYHDVEEDKKHATKKFRPSYNFV